MNPNLFRSVEFYQRRYHNYATVLIIPLSLLFTFILIFSLVATKEITVTSQGEIAPTSVIASIQSTSDNPILANHLVANQVVEKGDLLIKYSETMEESQKTALATQLQRLTPKFQIKLIFPIAVHQLLNKKLQKFNNKLENIKS